MAARSMSCAAPLRPFLLPQRSLFTLQKPMAVSALTQLRMTTQNPLLVYSRLASFSLRSRKKKADKLAKSRATKYKLKTKKAFQKRVRVVGSFREKTFKYFASNHRHLMRNKTRRERKFHRTRHVLKTLGDQRKARQLMPYYKRRKFLNA